MKLLIEDNAGIIRYEKDEYTFIPDPDILDNDSSVYPVQTGDLSKSIQIAPFLKRIGADKSSRKVGTDKPDFPIQQENIYVFILDTGIYTKHENLNIRKDLCKNFTTENDYNDEKGHGTHVAGIIGAKGLNGVYGVSPGVQLIAYKVLDSTGKGQKSNLMAGLDDILNFKKNLNNKSQVIVNLSLSGSGNENEDKLIEKMIDNNITVVIAAGNKDMSVESISPARSKGITVGSYDAQTNVFSKSSNYGIEVDMAAPGVRIKSTSINNSYEIKSGTSMAAPVVTGAVVNMVARSMKNGKILTPYQIKARLQADAINAYKEGNNPILDDTNKDNIFRYSAYIGNDQLY
jgi:subtilisin family serine protease